MRWHLNSAVILACAIHCVAAGGKASQVVLSDLPASRVFTLRQIHHHGAHRYPHLHRYVDVEPGERLIIIDEHGDTFAGDSQYHAWDDVVDLSKASFHHDAERREAADTEWTTTSIRTPNVTDKETVLSFAKMAANAYARKDNSSGWEWQDVGSGFNYTDDFGWETDGLRGHVFADVQNQTVVISLKGTSVPWFDDPDTTMRDLQNDNIFGSCCCAQGGSHWWKPVCNCKSSAYTCNATCLTNALQTRNSYYWAAQELYYNITLLYPRADIWLTGHSLGGVVSSLLGLTFGLPTLTFEAFPDALAASRLGLDTPPGYAIGEPEKQALHASLVHHFGHTADPIFMGTCNGALSYCSFWGYAFEGLCHTGTRCVYDTVQDLKWKEDVRTHSIIRVIKEVLQVYDAVPNCHRDIDCVDCAKWKFFESNHT